ncbi:MAG: ABC transporter permease [Anaerolineae bacterium]|jgi:ABC-2 type transport system permease protein
MNPLNIALKDILILLKNRGQVLMTFLLPIVTILVFTAAFAAGEGEDKAIVVPVVNLDPGGAMSGLLLQNLNLDRGIETQDYDRAQAEEDLENEAISMALYIPEGFTADVEAGLQATLRLRYGPGASDSEIEAVRLVIDGVASDLALQTQLINGLSQMGAMMFDAPEDIQVFTAERIKVQAESQFERSRTDPLVAVTTRVPEQISRGREEFNLSSFSVAGFAILFAFLIAQDTASSIFGERREGTFRRLLAAPMSKGDLLLGKMLPNFLIVLLQMAIIFAVSLVLLPLLGLDPPEMGNSLLGLIVVTIMVALCSTSLGILIAALARTQSQVGGISSLVLWLAGLFGGAFIPGFLLSGFLDTIGKVVPHYWALQAYNNLMIRGQGLVDILPELGILAGFTVVFFVIGLLRFRFD